MQAQVAVADFDAGDAAEAVRGDGHAFDQVFLDGAVGFRSAWQRSARSRRSAGSSPGRMGDLLVSPWTVLLRLERALPSAVRGRWISALCAAIVSAGTTQAGIFAPGRNVQSRRHLAPGESFGFGRQVVDMGSIEGDVTEPGADGVDVHPGLQEG